MQAHALVDKALVIARDGSDFYRDDYRTKKMDYDRVKRCELRVRQYQWLCSKLAPHMCTTIRNNAPAVAIQQSQGSEGTEEI